MTEISAFTDDALGDSDAVGVGEAIAAGQVSRREVADAAVARCRSVNPRLNAIAYEIPDPANRPPASDSIGAFAGVPTVIKDMVQVAGAPTTHGSDAWDATPSTRDGAFMRQFRRLGAVPLGMTTMSEFGLSAVAEHPRMGPVRNPWNTDHTAGGSSSGSAVLVASGAVPFAHAVDGGGSIRIPASCCGLVGLKPTRGRLPLDTEMRFIPIRIASNGVLTRSVRDTAAFYRDMERVRRPRSLEPIGDVTSPDPRRLRIAVGTRSPFGQCGPEVQAEINRVAALLESAGHRVDYLDPIPVPSTFSDDFVKYYSLLGLTTARLGKRRFNNTFDPSKLDAFTHGLARQASEDLASILRAIIRLKRARRFSDNVFRDYDVLMTPTVAEPPPPVGDLGPNSSEFDDLLRRVATWASFTAFQIVTGEPSISLPTGGSASGLPIGTLYSAPTGKEARLLHLAFELDEIQPLGIR